VLATVHSYVLMGIDAIVCEVEVDVSKRGLSRAVIVGLAQTAVKESIERVRRAMINSGFAFPQHALLINLAPADVKKEGPSLDLPMAIGLLPGSGSIETDVHKQFLIAGELALDGRVAFKLVESAQNHWRKLNGSTLLPEVIAGVMFKDGTKLAA
jgi:magnesium chelatase family protein